MAEDPLFVSAYEKDQVRLFHLDVTDAELQAIRAPKRDMPPTAAAIAELVGLDWIDGTYAELFAIADLDSFGLSNFLIQGAGVPEAQVLPAKEQIDALEGVVLVLYSKAFEGKEQQLHLARNITLFARFAEEETPVSMQPIESAAASEPSNLGTQAPHAHTTVLKAMLALPAVAIAIGLLLWLVLK